VIRFCVHGDETFEFPDKPVKILINRVADKMPSEQLYKRISSCLLVSHLYVNAKCACQLSLNIISARTGSKFLPQSPPPFTSNLISLRLRRKYFIPDSFFPKNFLPRRHSSPSVLNRPRSSLVSYYNRNDDDTNCNQLQYSIVQATL
jgi:hypothetical protein